MTYKSQKLEIYQALPVIFCLDVEPDARHPDPSVRANWAGFEATAEFFNELRPRLEEATGAPAKFNWFLRMDPQVERVYGCASWVVQQYGKLIEQLERAGDEIGLHIHAGRWNETTREWIVDHGDQHWIEHCVRTSFRAYEESLGRPCRSFRFGDRWMNNETMHLLESLGIEFDLTIEPGTRAYKQLLDDEHATGSCESYIRAPRQPFRPSRQDFKRPADGDGLNLWSIPLSTGRRLIKRTGWLAPVRWAVSTYRCRHQPFTLNLAIQETDFTFILDQLLEQEKTQYLTPVARTDAASRPLLRPRLHHNVDTFLSHPKADRFVFVKPNEVIRLLNSEQHAAVESETRLRPRVARSSSH